MTATPGTRLGDRYRIVEELGAGGMGVVYVAFDEKLDRRVALKTVPRELVKDGTARARLIREAKSAAGLEHPGIAQVFDVGETPDGGAFLVMELVRGKSFRALLDDGLLERPVVVEIIREIAAALHHAHSRGLVHRDVKPDNVMIRDDGRAALLDFGLAKDFEPNLVDTVSDAQNTAQQITREGLVVGTIAYLSPEQLCNEPATPKSDQFALAVTAYEALTGDRPFRGPMGAVVAQIVYADRPRPSLSAGLPGDVDEVFERALAKDAEDRYPSTVAFAEALEAAFVGDVALAETVMAQMPSAREAAAPPSRRRRRGPILGLLLLAIVGITMAASLLWDEDPVPAAVTVPSTVGCPVLAAEGVDEPRGWLGAMAAHLACRQLATRLGGDPTRTRAPAQLLDLPIEPRDDFPTDPYGAEDARERSLAAASELDAVLDGRVRREEDGTMEVTLRLMVGGEERGAGSGRSAALYEAVARALTGALATLPMPTEIEPELAPWIGAERVDVALAFEQLGDAAISGVGVEAHCRELIEAGEASAIYHGEVRRICSHWGVQGAERLTPPPLDRSSPARLALTVPAHGQELEPEELLGIARELRGAMDDAEPGLAKAVLARGAIAAYELLDEREEASDLALAAAVYLPDDWYLRVHRVRLTLGTPASAGAAAALAAWHPSRAEAWRTLALPAEGDDEVRWYERAYLSGGRLPLYGIYLAHALLRRERAEEVRGIAARFATGGPAQRLAGEYLRARLDVELGRLGAAYDRLLAAVSELEGFGRFVNGDVDAMRWLLRVSEALDRERATADPLVRRFVLAEPHRLLVDQPHYEVPAIQLCRRASPELAAPCFATLRRLRADRAARAGRVDGAEALLSGAERAAAGDDAGAVLAWRPLLRTGFADDLDPEVFRRADEPDLAARVEEARLAAPTVGGANPAQARAAIRAAEAGDVERARTLARQVIDAWSASDVPVPAVDAMRELLGTLPAEE